MRAGLIFLFLVASEIGNSAMSLSLTSPSFSHHGEISRRYTCEGEDVSPPLAWSGLPEGTPSLALIVDPDAPNPKAAKMTWVHWVLYNLPPTAGALPEAVAPKALPPGTKQGLNDRNSPGYGGPCPPIGRHRYFHKLYALDAVLTGLDTPTKGELLKVRRPQDRRKLVWRVLQRRAERRRRSPRRAGVPNASGQPRIHRDGLTCLSADTPW